jgi:membrane fusion protein
VSVTQLFRPEVIDHRAERLHGEVILTQTLNSRVLTLFLAAVIGAAAIWLTVGHYSRIETARGILVTTAGSSKVFALRPGVVSSLLVKDGDRVSAGQRLALVESEQASASGERYSTEGGAALSAQEQLADQQINLSGARAASEQARLSAILAGLVQQRASLTQQIQLQQQVVSSSRETFQQIGGLVEKGFITRLEQERRRQSYISAQQGVAQLSQQLASANTDYARTQVDLGRTRINSESEIVDVRNAVQSIRQQKSRLDSEGRYSIEAPITGRVTAIQTGAGRTVGGVVPMMVITPDDSPLKAELYVPSRAIGFVRKSQNVRLLYDTFPYQRFGSFEGRIDTISRVVTSPQETDVPFKIEEPVYRVTALLTAQSLSAFGEKVRFQPGMTLTGNIVLERQSFWGWLMTPFNAVGKRS